MRFSNIVGVLSLVSGTYASACPFAALRDAGLLSEADAAKVDAVRRDGQAAEHLLHERDCGEQKRDNTERGIIDSLLGLPLGGGIRTYIIYLCIPLSRGILILQTGAMHRLTVSSSRWSASAPDRYSLWVGHPYAAAAGPQGDSWR
jgi:hypothetical protein